MAGIVPLEDLPEQFRGQAVPASDLPPELGGVVAAKPKTERTIGESILDVPASVITGLGSLAQFPGQVVKLVPGLQGVGEALETPGEYLAKAGEALKSEGLKAREALRSKALSEAEKDGVLSQFATAITSTITDPALLTSFVAEQVPLLIGPGGAAKLTQILGRKGVKEAGEGLAGKAAEDAMLEAAQRLNVQAARAAIGTGAAMQGADIGSDAYDAAYQAALRMGMTEEQARDEAMSAARMSALGAGAISLGTAGLLSKFGGSAIERRLAGLPGAGRVPSVLGETVSESLEEGGGQLAQNIALRQIDPSQSLTAGVGAAAGLGALGGGVFGGILGAKPKAELAPGQAEGESLYDAAMRINREIQYLDTLAQDTGRSEERQQAGVLTNTELVDMYRDQGYGAVKQYQVDLARQLREATDAPTRIAIGDAFRSVSDLLTQVTAEEYSRRAPSNVTNVLTDTDVATKLGIPRNDPVYSELVGKDIGKPADAQAVIATLEGAMNRKGVRKTQVERFATALTSINEFLATIPGSGFYAATPVQQPSGAGAPVAGVPGERPAAGRTEVSEPSGVVRTPEIAGEPARGEGVQPPAVEVKREEVVQPPAAPTPEVAVSAPPAPAVEAPAPAPAVETVTRTTSEVLKDISALEEKRMGLLTKSGRLPAVKSPARQKYNALVEQIDSLNREWDVANKAERAAKAAAPVAAPVVAPAAAPVAEAPSVAAPATETVLPAGQYFPGDQIRADGRTWTIQRVAHTGKELGAVTAGGTPHLSKTFPIAQAAEPEAAPKKPSLRSEALDKTELKADPANYAATPLRGWRQKGDSYSHESGFYIYKNPETLWYEAVLPSGGRIKDLSRNANDAKRIALREVATEVDRYETVAKQNQEQESKKSVRPETEARAAEILKQRAAAPAAAPEAAPETAPQPTKTQAEQYAEARAELVKQLDGILKRILAKYGLKDVTLNLKDAMEDQGSYGRRIIELALNVDNPVRTLRHESIHALKDMGFFSDAQWKVLEKRAKDEWIGVLQKTKHDATQSRYDAYVKLFTQEGTAQGLTGDALTKYVEEAVIEEAIADAFGDFDATKAPPGMMNAILNRMRNLFKAIKEAFGIAGIESAEDIFGKIEEGKLKPTKEVAPKAEAEPEAVKATPSIRPQESNAWQASDTERQEALDMYNEDGFLPYVSQGFLNVPLDGKKYSLQKYNPEKHLAFDPVLNVPINKDGTITAYYHTTKAGALNINNNKMIAAEGRNRIYLTNESGGADVLRNRGSFDQELDGSTVLVYVTPDMLQVDQMYDNGRVDFFIPLAQGEYFNKKMKMQSIQKARTEAIAQEFSYDDHEEKITKAIENYKAAPAAAQKAMVKRAKEILKREHNVASLLTENGKLEKTRIGEYDLSYDGLPVASQGLGLASAQKITDKTSTCPRSSICEGLCLGETSGGNFMFGGAAAEDVGDIQKSAFRAGARMMQYLKTEALIVHPQEFAVLLQSEIDALKRWSEKPTQRKKNPETGKVETIAKEIYAPAVRLNVTSDFKPEMFRGVIEGNPDVMFYDYTKINSNSIADNHHLTYSSTGFGQIVDGERVFFKNKAGNYDHNWGTVRQRLNDGYNVAMAFSSKSGLPKTLTDEETGIVYKVLDGDLYDARFLDEYSPEKRDSEGRGVIVGLRNKAGTLSEKNATQKTGGFFVNYDPKRDGSNVTVPDQAQFKPRRIPITAKPSLRAPQTEAFKRQVKYDKNTGRLDVEPGQAVRLSGLGRFGAGDDALAAYVPQRSTHTFALHPDKWVSTFYSLANKDAEKITRYKPAAVDIVPGTLVADMALANRFYRSRDEADARAYADSVKPLEDVDLSTYRMPELLIPKQDEDITASKQRQIKSAIGNGGTYDLNDPDIRRSLRSQEKTPQFKFWFGQSQVVDKDGKPKKMYHGTARDIEAFQAKQANAIFLTDDPEVAANYAQQSMQWMQDNADKFLTPDEMKAAAAQAETLLKQSGYTKPQIAALKRDKGFFKTDEYREAVAQYLPTGPNIIPAYVSAQNVFDFENAKHLKAVMSIVGDKVKREDFDRTNNWTTVESPEVQNAIRTLGFDGFYVSENGDKNLAVYSPNQVKSVFNEAPTQRPELKLSLRAPTSPEFKRWFGNSRVVDANGEPLVVYHGTAVSNIGVFKGYRGVAAHFAFDPEFANGFAEQANEAEQERLADGDEDIGDGGQVYAAYLRASNIFDARNPEHLRAAGIEAVEDYATLEGNVRKIKAAGFDSYYDFENSVDDPPTGIAVFSPEQIKSATGNIGTYSPETADIRYSLRGRMSPGLVQSMNKIAPPTYQPNLGERILNAINGDSFTRIRAGIVNRYEALAEMDRRVAKEIQRMGGVQQLADSKAETAALFSDLGAGLLETAMGAHDRVGGVPVFRNGMTVISSLGGTVKGPIAIFKPLSDLKDPNAFRLYQTWAAVKRGSRLNVEGREQLIDAADIAAMRAMEQANPNLVALFDAVQKDWIAYNNGLVKYMKDTGVITDQMAREYTKHGDYFPFYRLVEEDVLGPKMFTSIGNVRAPKKLKGGEAPLGDFFENIVRNSQAAIQAGIKNVAAQRATNQALLLNEVTRLPTKQPGARVYRVLENGREVFYEAHDPLFIESIKALNMADLPFLGLLSAPANLLRNLVTKDPAFMLANMMRDSLSAWTTSGVNMTPMIDTFKNFGKAIAGQSPELQKLYAAGVLGGYDYAQTAEASGREFQKRLREVSGTKTKFEKITSPATSLWGALEKGTQASDAATRIEVYKRVLAETGNEAEAYWQALEVMNFNRKGNSPVIRVLTAAIPFLNARMQGLDLLFRTAIMPMGGSATEQAKSRMKTFFVRGMSIMAMSSMYWLLTHDDDDYKKQEQETRDNFWLIPSLGIKIPIPFEVGVMFKVIPERIMALSFGTDTAKDFTDSMKRQFVSTFGFNPIPQAVLPIVEVKTNYSFFTQRPIIGKGLEGVAPQFQIGPGTSRVAELIGKSAGMSPMQIDYLIKGYTGTMGQYASDLFDMVFDMTADNPKASKRFEQMPIIRRFALDPEARGNVTNYYKFKDSVDEIVRSSNLLERSMNFEEWGPYYTENIKMLAVKDYVNDLEKTMKDYREMRQMILSSPMSADNKKDALVSIGRMEDALTSNIQTLKKQTQ